MYRILRLQPHLNITGVRIRSISTSPPSQSDQTKQLPNPIAKVLTAVDELVAKLTEVDAILSARLIGQREVDAEVRARESNLHEQLGKNYRDILKLEADIIRDKALSTAGGPSGLQPSVKHDNEIKRITERSRGVLRDGEHEHLRYKEYSDRYNQETKRIEKNMRDSMYARECQLREANKLRGGGPG